MKLTERLESEPDPFFSMVESVVLDWLNKYPLESPTGKLSVENPADKEQVKQWVTGVWGRISHQLTDSGLPIDNRKILAMARDVFNREVARHPWYEQIKDLLPTAPPSTGWLDG